MRERQVSTETVIESSSSNIVPAAEGIMYSAAGDLYVAEALVSARSSLRHNRVPHVLFASPLPDVEECDGLSVESFEPCGDPYIDKIANIRRSPFERTIFLDTDTYVVGEIVHVLRLLDHYELAAAYAPGYRGKHDPEVPAAFYEFNTGVIALRAGERVEAFLGDWQEKFHAWRRDEPFRSAAGDDQPSFRRCAWEHQLKLLVLAPEYNYRTILPQTVVDRVRVIHGRYLDFEALATELNGRRGARSFQPQGLTTFPGGALQFAPTASQPAGFVEKISRIGTTAQRHLFVSGPARSGTTALTFLLNKHPQIVLGVERFKRIMSSVDPAHFEPDIFCKPIQVETDVLIETWYDEVRAKLDGDDVRLIGDKEPRYVRHLQEVSSRFPDALFVVTTRELSAVAASFQRRASDPEDRVWGQRRDARAAIGEYNDTLRRVREFGETANGERLFILPYEPFFGGEEIWLEALFAFLDLPVSASIRAHYRVLVAEAQARAQEVLELDSDMLTAIEEDVDREALAWCRARLDEQLASVLATGEFTEQTIDVPALEESYLAQWRLERTGILDAMWTVAGERGDSGPVLRERLGQLGNALNARTDQLLERERELQAETGRRSAAEAAAARAVSSEAQPRARSVRSGDARFRLTFLLPHQRRTTGGIYAIEQYARFLRATMDVQLAVQETTPTPLRGTTAAWALDAGDLPDADALVVPAETPDEWLLTAPARKGRPILYLQGFATPGSAQTPANLERFGDPAAPRGIGADPDPDVIAVSRWAATEAAQVGCKVAYVPLGLDRSVFARGPDTTKRRPIVAMMTHEAEWKGVDDGLKALAHVRAERPDVELVLFGTASIDIACEFMESPGRDLVATLLQRACVYIVPSWEEGFGMSGLEALACGAALATTDTKGSRDYAEDGQTALVSFPRDPATLARNVLRLLDDGDLRSRLLENAASLLAERVPTWDESAALFAQAVMGAPPEAG